MRQQPSSSKKNKIILLYRAIRNLVHSSETAEEAEQEIALWFNMADVELLRDF